MVVRELETCCYGIKYTEKDPAKIGGLLDNQSELCNYVKNKLWN